MNLKLEPLLEAVRANFWFVPTTMILLTLGMASFTIYIDVARLWSLERFIPIIYSTNVEAIRSLLSTISAAMITVTSIAFSITIVALTLASSQFGPRLLRNFMKDRTTQIVLGVFISNFLYCIFVVCAISLEQPYTFKPGVTVIWAILMTCVSIGFLIHFIHHVSISIQADTVIEDVYCELKDSIAKLFPEQTEAENVPSDSGNVPKSMGHCEELRIAHSGYLQLIDLPPLMELLTQVDAYLFVHYSPGNYLVKGSVFGELFSKEPCTGYMLDRIKKNVVMGSQRTPIQDPEFAIGQLVEVALRALSPGINDPFTAITCVDKLSSALCKLTSIKFPKTIHTDAHGASRLRCKSAGFTDLAKAAFDQIRQHAENNTAVTIRLLESLSEVALKSSKNEHYQFVREQLLMISEQQNKRSLSTLDQQRIERTSTDIGEYLESGAS